jgi:hypothetical protein
MDQSRRVSSRSLLRTAFGMLVTLFMASVAGGAPPAAAQSSNSEYQCTSDVMRLCSEFIPSRDPIIACLLRKRQQLSPGCQTVMKPPPKKWQGKKRRVREASDRT